MIATNVVEAYFGGARSTRTRGLYQYDYGQVLRFADLSVPSAYQVHFSNVSVGGEAVTQIGGADGVTIPDALLTTGKPIYAWVFLHTGADDGETRYTVYIPVTARSKATDVEPTPVQQDAITQAIAALNAAVEQTAADVETTGENVTLAQAAQDAAEAAKQDAANSATNAAEAADTAEDARDAVQDMGVTATTLAPGSAATVDKSVNPQTGAVTLAFGIPRGDRGEQGPQGETGDTGATPDLTIGTVDTLEPGEDATATITGTPENPVLNLGIPRGNPGEVTDDELQSALLNKADVIVANATGAVASFTDGAAMPVKSMVVDIEPVQDLNGYDHPWPAGGGKNKLASTVTKDVTILGDTQTVVVSLTKNVAEITIDRDLTASLGYRLNDGSIETVLPAGNYFFSTNITNQSVGSGLFIFNATTGTILGRARAEGGASISLSDETTVRLGLSLSAATKAGTYWFQLESGSTATSFAPYKNICPITGWNSVNVCVSPTINAEDGRTYSIVFPASACTVYGGTLDVTNGKLTVDRASVDMGELGWVFMNVNGTRRLCSVVLNPLPLTPNSDYYMPEIICSVYKVVNVNQLPNITYSISMGFRGYGYGNRLIVNDETITTVEQTVEKLSGQTCVYKLLTPTTYTLTASQIRTLLGENNIWADTGDVAVDYRADTKLYIDGKIAALLTQREGN